ncbi:MAG: TaqI-like C-terminal specificity domain-containing protein [Lachnospiraceae bacterium]
MGYLQKVSTGTVSKESVTDFTSRYVGTTKLVSRANKSSKDVILADFDVTDYNGSDISAAYEASLSDSYKNKEGIFYTPTYVVSDMMRDMHPVNGDETFLEPCCGSGNFVLEAVKKGIKPENIYAFDIDAKAVEITKQRLYAVTGYHSCNIICADFLQIGNNLNRQFDYIYTNPPWGKKICKMDREKWTKVYKSGNSSDTCALFFFACMRLLQEDGQLGFLLPKAFFNIATFEDARKYALMRKIVRLMNYGKAFKGLMTDAEAIILHNAQPTKDTAIQCETKGTRIERTIRSFTHAPKSIINFSYSEQDAEIIEYIYALPHITLAGNAIWGLGVVTGNNKEHCSDVPKEGYVPIYRGKDITENGFSEPSLFIHNALRGCQQVAPIALYQAKEKLVYRFISDKLVFCCDKQQRYVLNSANMLILNTSFPLGSQQVADIMNSKLMNWLYRMLFATHKVLRGDLEMLPIFADYFKKYAKFDEEKYLDFLNLEELDGTYRIKRNHIAGI